MSWVYLDDKFAEHPKVVAAGGDAGWLWVCGLGYCNRNLTEGYIPKVVVPRLTDRRNPNSLAAKLVAVGLWEDKGAEFYVHDYLEWNRSAEAAKAKQRERSEKARKAAEARWNKPPADAPSNADAYAQALPEQCVSNASSTCVSNAQPMPRVRERARTPSPSPSPVVTSPSQEPRGKHQAAPPDGGGGRGSETTKTLAQRLASVCTGKSRQLVDTESLAVVEHCTAHVDQALVDECIGRAASSDPPPALPRYLVPVVQQHAAQHGIAVPDWKPPT